MSDERISAEDFRDLSQAQMSEEDYQIYSFLIAGGAAGFGVLSLIVIILKLVFF
jgi:hypothetical protein